MEIHLSDIAIWSYIYIFLVSLWGFILFEWWRRKSDHASEVYVYIELLMIANVIYYGFNTYARWMFLNDPSVIIDTPYENFITGIFWKARAIPVAILISCIVFRMTLRARTTCKRIAKFEEHVAQMERRQVQRREVDRVK